MIIVKLMGGLGNQMFQYAFGRSISEKLDNPLFFDTSFYEDHKDFSHTPRRFCKLDVFDIELKLIDRKTVTNFYYPSYFQRKVLNVLNILPKIVFTEKSLQFDPSIAELKPSIYFEGYWQTENYFRNIEKQIRHEFLFKSSLNLKSSQILEDLAKKKKTVSIHVRRGDYVSSSKLSTIHGTCSVEYFLKAIALINSKFQNPFFYIFSDDIKWVQKNLIPHLCNYCIVSHNNDDDTSWQDMFLMSKCENQIISNSTFSWWAAWLNINPNKIVIAPKKWYNDTTRNTQDLIPESWIKI